MVERKGGKRGREIAGRRWKNRKYMIMKGEKEEKRRDLIREEKTKRKGRGKTESTTKGREETGKKIRREENTRERRGGGAGIRVDVWVF